MSWMDEYKVTVPEGEIGDWKLERFTVEPGTIEGMRLVLAGRSCRPGTYTRLLRRNELWMSDTPAEISDHLGAIRRMEASGGNVLIHGLGIGMVLAAALRAKDVKKVDVVEIDPDVISLVGDHYMAMAAENGTELVIHCDDALTKKWPAGSRWTIVWHDIWINITEDNLPDMHKLHRSFGRRCDWQGSWGRELIEAEKRRTANAPWRW